MSRRDALGLSLLAAVGVITAAWWALALWPFDAGAPTWLVRTRFACFGAADNGLPHAGGNSWIGDHLLPESRVGGGQNRRQQHRGRQWNSGEDERTHPYAGQHRER